MKNKLLLFLSIVAIVTIGLVNSVRALSKDLKTFDYSNEYLKLNWKQTQLAGKIDEFLKEDTYPSYFGGIYISDDSKNVVVQIVKDNIPKENTEEYSKYEKMLNMDDSIKIEYVRNSYEELKKSYEKILGYFSPSNTRSSTIVNNMSATYIDTLNNVVVAEVKDNGSRMVKSFKDNVINSENIVFKKATVEASDYALLRSGAGITSMGVENNCSMGFKASLNGQIGYITAAHCVNNKNDYLPSGTIKKYQYSGSIDAMFVATNSSYTPSNVLMYPSPDGTITQLNTVMASPYLGIGTVVAKSGAKTQYTSGKITYTNYSMVSSGVLFSNLVATDAVADHGDSGAPVFIPNNLQGGATVAGILKGGATGTDHSMIFVRGDKIFESFGFIR